MFWGFDEETVMGCPYQALFIWLLRSYAHPQKTNKSLRRNVKEVSYVDVDTDLPR